MPTTTCSFCEQNTTTICPLCSRPFCTEHQGPEGDFCQDCSATDAMPEKREAKEALTKIEESADFVDSEGTPHPDVRVMRPVGEFYVSTSGSIAHMSDQELERFYNRYSMLVHDCEAALDRHRIVRSMIAMEKEERLKAAKIEQRAYKAMPAVAKKVANAVAGAPSDTKLAVLAVLLKKQGLTADKLRELINKKKGEKANGDATTREQTKIA
jgi:hypothetical protein